MLSNPEETALQLKALKVQALYETLEGDPKDSVQEVWFRLGYLVRADTLDRSE